MNKEKRPWIGVGVSIVPITITVGIFYIINQWASQSNIEDPYFVGIIMANTYAIYRFTMFLRRHLTFLAKDYKYALGTSSIKFDEDVFINDIFNPRKALFYGLLFGTIFLVSTLFVLPWGVNSQLNILLGIFLQVANVLTGMALYSLFIYFRYSLLIGANIEVDLWDRSSPAISSLVETNRSVVLATAFASCAGMMSIIDSKFTFDYSIIVFSIFSISLILLAYVIPLIPITTQIRRKKKQSMNELGLLIQNEYAELLNAARDAKSTLDTRRFDSLSSVYKSVKSIKAFPPVGEQSINTAISVTFLTLLPSVIEFVLKITG